MPQRLSRRVIGGFSREAGARRGEKTTARNQRPRSRGRLTESSNTGPKWSPNSPVYQSPRSAAQPRVSMTDQVTDANGVGGSPVRFSPPTIEGIQAVLAGSKNVEESKLQHRQRVGRSHIWSGRRTKRKAPNHPLRGQCSEKDHYAASTKKRIGDHSG